MSERSKYLTVIVSEPTQEEASALIGHPKMSAASWSHAIHDRDAKDAEIAELRAKLARQKDLVREGIGSIGNVVQSERRLIAERDEARQQHGNASVKLAQCVLQRDEARECIRRLYPFAAEYEAEVSAELNTDRLTPDARRKYEYKLGQVRSAIASIPESLHAD